MVCSVSRKFIIFHCFFFQIINRELACRSRQRRQKPSASIDLGPCLRQSSGLAPPSQFNFDRADVLALQFPAAGRCSKPSRVIDGSAAPRCRHAVMPCSHIQSLSSPR